MREVVEQMWGWDEDTQDELFDRSFNLIDRWIVQVDGCDVGTIRVTHRSTGIFLDDSRETVIGRSRWRDLVGPSMTGKPQRR